jgi:hypothetical protein
MDENCGAADLFRVAGNKYAVRQFTSMEDLPHEGYSQRYTCAPRS